MSAASKREKRSGGSILRASAVMASGTMVSRLLGFIRNAMLLAVIGSAAGGVNAAFQTANTLPNVVFNILASGVLDALLVPQIVAALKSKHQGQEYVNRLLTLAGTILFGITVLAMVAAPLLVIISSAGYGPEIRSLAIAFALLCLPQIFFYGLYNLLGELLNARGVFGPYMWAPVVNNVVGIAGLALFLALWGSSPTRFNIADLTGPQFWLLGGSATLGVICQALVLLIPMKRAGITLRPDFRFRGTSFGSASKVAGWTFATLGVSQFGVISSNNLAALADSWGHDHGTYVVGISAMATAFMIYMVPQSLVSVSMATAVFTRISTAVVDRDEPGVAHYFHLGVRSTNALTMLLAAVLAATSVPVMQTVLASQTDPTLVRSYAWVLLAFLPGLSAMGILLMTQRVFYAYEDARPIFLSVIIPNVLQIIVGWSIYALTDAHWWVVGAALGETLCRISQAYIGLRLVSHRNSHIDVSSVIRTYLSHGCTAAVAALVGAGLMWLIGIDTFADSTAVRALLAFIKICFVGLITALVHLLVLRLVAPHESANTVRPLLKRLRVPSRVISVLAASPAGQEGQATVVSQPCVQEGHERGIIGETRTAERTVPSMEPDQNGISPVSEGMTSDTPARTGEAASWTDDSSFPASSPLSSYEHDDVDGHAPAAFVWTPPADDVSATLIRFGPPDVSDPLLSDVLETSDDNTYSQDIIEREDTLDAAVAEDAPVARFHPLSADEQRVADSSMAVGSSTTPDTPDSDSFVLSQPVEETLVRSIPAADPLPPADSLSLADENAFLPPTLGGLSGDDLAHMRVIDPPTDHPAPLEDMPPHLPEPLSSPESLSPPEPPAVPVPPPTTIPPVVHVVTPRTHPTTSASPAASSSSSAEGSDDKTWSIDPTIPSFVIAGALVLFGGLWALFTALSPIDRPAADSDATTDTAESAQSAPLAPAEPTSALPTPQISSAQVFSWDGEGDHEDEAINMVDGQPETQWHSRWFDDNSFAEDNTVTVLIKLKERAPVSQITLAMDPSTSGGMLVARSTTPEAPRQGTELATTALSPTTTITLPTPVETDTISLSFRTMPTSVDGKAWAWINEITVK